MIQHRHQCQRHADHDSSSKTLWTFILSFIFFGIIFYLCDRDSPTTLIIETTKVVEKDAVAMPVSCRGTAQCPGRQASFEHSNLLTREHQNHLNSFYNDTDSRVSRWKLIYRLATPCQSPNTIRSESIILEDQQMVSMQRLFMHIVIIKAKHSLFSLLQMAIFSVVIPTQTGQHHQKDLQLMVELRKHLFSP